MLQEKLCIISRPAAGDLSAGIYRFVELNSSGQVSVANAAGEHCIGVLQNNPSAAGQAAAVAVAGSVVKVVAGGTVAANAKVATTAAGAALTAVSTNNVLGTCLEGGVIGDLIMVLLDHQGVLA